MKLIGTTTILVVALLGCQSPRTTTAFVLPTTATTTIVTSTTAFVPHRVPTVVQMSDNDNNDSSMSNSKKPFDEKLRSKLVSEAIAPWRTVRLFVYGTLGASALLGGLITLAGTAAALQGLRPDLDLNEQVRRKNGYLLLFRWVELFVDCVNYGIVETGFFFFFPSEEF